MSKGGAAEDPVQDPGIAEFSANTAAEPEAETSPAVLRARQQVLRVLGASVPGLAKALGSDSEVVIHDLSRIPNSIVALGGDLTGRTHGGPVTDLLLRHVRHGHTEDMIRYKTSHPDGRIFRSSTVFLRDEDGTPFACLCINTDMTPWLQARQLLDTYVATSALEDSDEPSPSGPETEESFLENVTDLAATMIRQAVEAVGVPVSLMHKPHKLAVVRELDRRGLFVIKDAVDTTARALSVTRFTIYNYLNEIRDGADQEESLR
ncbi:helix-turn-helix transcriptional regulator [Streptomyces sp. NPDC002143]